MGMGQTWFQKYARPACERFLMGLWQRDGAQLLEFALVLPMMLLLLLGAIDFASAFTLKQKLNNASREGVRFTITEAQADVSQWPSVPNTTQSILNDILTYLTNAGVNVCGLTSSSGASSTPSYGDWIFSATCSDTGGKISIEINRGITFVDSNGVTVLENKITIIRPYKWSGIVAPVIGTQRTNVSTDATMEQ
jgi:Flp pilus assembly protein TadG